MMGFVEAVRTCVRDKYVTFSGRASRSEYWWFTLFYLLMMIAAGFLLGGFGALFGGAEAWGLSTLAIVWIAVIYIALIFPAISVWVRRFHDRDMSGWWVLGLIVLGAIPYVGIVASIVSIVIVCLKGTEGPNRFGPDPLNPAASAEVFN